MISICSLTSFLKAPPKTSMTNNHPTKTQIYYTHHLIKALVLVSLLALLYWSSILNLIYAWKIKPQCSHGYFIMPISIWLCWQRRNRWQYLTVNSSCLGFFLLLPGLFFYVISIVAVADTIANISLMLTLAGVVILTFGTAVFKAYLFPYLFLIFMFPIPDALYLSLTNPLKLFASSISTIILQAVGIPIFQDGNILQFANFQMQVVEACSGMRSLVTYLMLSTLLSNLHSNGFWKKCLLIISAIPNAFFNNIFRITGTGVLAHWYGQKAAQGFFHEFTGFITFAVGFILLLGGYKILNAGALTRDKLTNKHDYNTR